MNTRKQAQHHDSMELKEWLHEVFPSRIRWRGAQGTARCPSHDDRRPSFSVNVEMGVWHCFAGCGSGTLRDLATRLGVEYPFDHRRRRVPAPRNREPEAQPRPKTRQHEREHVYVDEDGQPVLLIGRDGTGREKRLVAYHWRDGGWWTGKANARLVPYRLPAVRQAVAEGLPVFVVEGEKDADTLTAHGLVATTAPFGAGKWPAEEDFNRHFDGADVIILPDNDETGRKHAQQVAHTLKGYVKRLRVVELPGLPEKGDVTDWLEAGHTVDELLHLAQQTPDWEPKPGNLIALDGKLAQHVKMRYWHDGRFCPPLLAQDILRRQPFFFDGRRLYCYEGGVYRPHGEKAVRRWCMELLGNEYRANRATEAIHYIETATWIDDREAVNPEDGMLNVKNGLLDWRTGTLHPHTPERLSTIQLPVEYNPEAKCPAIEQFLHDVLPDEEAVLLLLEFVGYCLVPTTKYEKAMMFTGTGSNGKSTLIRLITALLGEENTTSIPLQELAESRWKRADLEGKLLNAFADISHKALESSSLFKAIVSGDTIDAERKHRDPFYFRPFAKLLFSANELPGSRDVTHAYFRRWLIVPFLKRFDHDGTADEDLIKRLTQPEELSGFLNLALDGLRRLEQQGHFTESPAAKKALEAYRLEADSVAGFLDEECVVSELARVTKAQLYEAYVQWCEEAGLKPLSKKRFGKRLLELVPSVTDDSRTNNARFWEGIGLRSEWGEVEVTYI